jgi:hypothetical protein
VPDRFGPLAPAESLAGAALDFLVASAADRNHENLDRLSLNHLVFPAASQGIQQAACFARQIGRIDHLLIRSIKAICIPEA